ncbi:hypothetical protein [Pedobacter sp. ASV12]|uniref:hypothetical protein n=1 Tax=Pedobacter sp. ASV12 TaxID=2795120 RepID=UPI0018EB971B|nr:hypothetical protein [Pedobacter sp. ASV12]
MRLDYKILWFEDVESSFNAKKRLVKRVVEKLGFIFPEPQNEVDATSIDTIDFGVYDLIIADLNLANGAKGSAILESIRDKGVYTEVVFYSSEGEDYVRGELAKFQIDGAYCADRANEDFIDKVEKVINTTVKKVQDLNNMRGLIMAETSDLDSIMSSIISAVLEKNTAGIGDKLTEFIYQNVGSKVKEKKDKYDRYTGKRIDKIIGDNLMFDASQKILAIQFIIDSIDHELMVPHKNNVFSSDYTVLKQKRDLLAHVIEVYENGKKKLKSGNRELEFTDEFCVEMRVKIKQHGISLNQILTLIVETNNT